MERPDVLETQVVVSVFVALMPQLIAYMDVSSQDSGGVIAVDEDDRSKQGEIRLKGMFPTGRVPCASLSAVDNRD